MNTHAREITPLVSCEPFGVSSHLFGDVFELIERWIDADEGKFVFNDSQVQSPDVFENSTNPSRSVVPTLAGRSRSVRAASNDDEDRGLVREGTLTRC